VTVSGNSGGNSPENSASLRLTSGPLSAPVLCRVVSMMLARADCPLDILDETMLICDALCAHASRHVRDAHLAFDVIIDAGRLELRAGELTEQGARGIIEDATLPEVGNVLERTSDEVRVEPSSEGDADELVVVVRFA
jgi:hypothetical protein